MTTHLMGWKKASLSGTTPYVGVSQPCCRVRLRKCSDSKTLAPNDLLGDSVILDILVFDAIASASE